MVKKRKNKIKFIVLFWIVVISVITYGLYYFTTLQVSKIERLEKKIAQLKEVSTPIKFKILDKQEGKIHFAIKFFDADGNVVNREELIMEGEELSFDFYVIPINERYIAFPNKIFTNKIAPKKGTELFDLYDNNGFPQIFYSKNIDNDIKHGLKELFTQLKTDNIVDLQGVFGSGIQDIKGINEFEKDNIYSIVIHTKGGIEIIEE